jgi:citrate lyase subunit beta/citryl-CoA lyase
VARLFRSVLFVPGTRPDRFARAVIAGADAVVFDLEDSVEDSRKAEARTAIEAYLSATPDATCVRLVRVNTAGSPWMADDLAMVGRLSGVHAVVLPKAETPAQVEAAAQSIASRRVVPLIETARGVLNAAAIAAADALVPALLFGAEDLTAQLGVPRTVDGEELLFARSQVVLAAASAGAEAVDAVFTDVAAMDQLRRDAERARAIGFRGKMVVHPDQVGIVNDVFSPTPAELDHARRIVAAYDAARAHGHGVIRLGDQMIDTPVIVRARRVLDGV